ncbi:hypothetical protein BUALT_Bualt07G0027100 [Buddleja alternifolia]|uniref:Serine/threonine-protein phosphatase 2A 55 kDa regulatory subunit B n=1 Tax=Buddleja alternifolia TaxID=168488 RepID=A0AAV6XBQ9_9LAMI|nr:hypothetical protein BUALT_Bualt07G0027100 [Buddleja alternifolia]
MKVIGEVGPLHFFLLKKDNYGCWLTCRRFSGGLDDVVLTSPFSRHECGIELRLFFFFFVCGCFGVEISQVFGDKLPGEDIQDIDLISAVEFDKSGNHLAVGDRGGRIVIFENNGGKDDPLKFNSRNELERLDGVVSKHPQYHYKTEFQSHEPEFDYLRSVEIEEKINKVRWCASSNGSLFTLSANDKTIKLWKVQYSYSIICSNTIEEGFINGQNPNFANGHSLEWTENMENDVLSNNGGHNKIACLSDAALARCRRVYAHAHTFSINSISVNSDWETFLSGDDLRINLWNLEISNQCFNIIDMKPVLMEDLIAMKDIGFFHFQLWDMNMDSSPVATFKIHENLRPKLCDLYNNDAIFDKFDCCVAGDHLNLQLVHTGYNRLRVFSGGIGSEEGVTVEANRNPIRYITFSKYLTYVFRHYAPSQPLEYQFYPPSQPLEYQLLRERIPRYIR